MKRKPSETDNSGVTLRRIFSIPVGIFYVMAMARIAMFTLHSSYLYALLVVSLGAIVQIALLITFGVKLSRTAYGESRFRISTIMLATAYLGVYLAAIRGTVIAAAKEIPSSNSGVALGAVIIGGLFIAMSTMILLAFAEALMHAGVLLIRQKRTRRH